MSNTTFYQKKEKKLLNALNALEQARTALTEATYNLDQVNMMDAQSDSGEMSEELGKIANAVRGAMNKSQVWRNDLVAHVEAEVIPLIEAERLADDPSPEEMTEDEMDDWLESTNECPEDGRTLVDGYCEVCNFVWK